MEFVYTCPNCAIECSVPESLTGQNLVCPSCSQEFFATPPEQSQTAGADETPEQQGTAIPSKLPFFKSGRKKLLAARLAELVEDGELDKADDKALSVMASQLDLSIADLSDLKREKFLVEFDWIKRRMESSFSMSDDDLEAIKALEKKYDIQLSLQGDNALFRSIYLLESNGQLPPPINTGLMLESTELVYYSVQATWHQTRVQNRGYAGTSVSVPSGIKGVRFRFGGYTPIRSEEMTPLSGGVLYVTSKRLLFNGEKRNTTVALKKIVDCTVFTDALRVEKSTGKPDLFSMQLAQARYVLALIGALK